MSKKKIVDKKLKKGKFYAVHEGSKHGHPGKLYWKNDQKNLYLFLKTGTTPSPENIVLTVPTQRGIRKSYIYKKPLLAKRKDVGGELLGMAFSKKDKKLLKSISKNPFAETYSVNRKDRRRIKRMRKRPKY